MIKVVVTTGAKQDLKEIKLYIATILMNAVAAKHVTKSITAQLHKLEQFPEMGKVIELEESSITYRYLLCGNYMAFYHIQNNSVFVDRILYGRRNYLKLLLGSQWEDDTEFS